MGYLTQKNMIATNQATDKEKASILAWNMFILSTFFWSICAYFFILMGRAEHDRKLKEQTRKTKVYAYADYV